MTQYGERKLEQKSAAVLKFRQLQRFNSWPEFLQSRPNQCGPIGETFRHESRLEFGAQERMKNREKAEYSGEPRKFRPK